MFGLGFWCRRPGLKSTRLSPGTAQPHSALPCLTVLGGGVAHPVPGLEALGFSIHVPKGARFFHRDCAMDRHLRKSVSGVISKNMGCKP